MRGDLFLKFGATIIVVAFALCLLDGETGSAAEPAGAWSTYRGSPQRTGNTDGVAGPAAPKVLWVHKTQEHFIDAPVAFGDRLYLSGLGAFNVSSLYCFSADPKAKQRVLWSQSTPYLKLPTVSSPALADGKLIFGDGMHQNHGSFLHCLRAENGMPLWQLPVIGELVHLEGAPTIAGGKAYIGTGSGGVLCVHLNRVVLDKKERSLDETRKILDEKWKELQAKYEEEKKKDPDFAVPPNEDQLPKPEPIIAWQEGKNKWHVDAPVALAGKRLLVASSFLDKEKLGDRALYCLDADSGKEIWRKRLTINPWGGPSLTENVVVVTGSTIGYEWKALKEAKGSITGFDLTSGKELWHKDLPGAVVTCAALADGLAIATATDGIVRAFDLKDGKLRWEYGNDKMAFFAPPAVAAGTVYAGDLNGVIHAINLADGKSKWILDLAADPQVKTPGMIYGGPVLSGGRLFVATCNAEGPHAGEPTVVVCIGER